MPAAPKFDLNKLANEPTKHVEVSISIKPPETDSERTHRLQSSDKDKNYERIKDTTLFLVVILGLATILGVCVVLALGHTTSPEDKKWATAVLTSTVTLLLGYLVGKEKSLK